MVYGYPHRNDLQLAIIKHLIPLTLQATRKSTVPLAHMGNVNQKKGETLKYYINYFNEMSNFVTWSPDAVVLAHLTNGVFSETSF